MTKTQLKTALANKFPMVADETKWRDITDLPFNENYKVLGFQVYMISVMDGVSDSKWDNNVLVIFDGTDYYWKNGEPKITPFGARLQAFINSKITDNTIQFGVIKDINQDLGKATVQVYMPDNSAKLLLITETSLNNFTYKVIG
jgi:hypothetical protein